MKYHKDLVSCHHYVWLIASQYNLEHMKLMGAALRMDVIDTRASISGYKEYQPSC